MRQPPRIGPIDSFFSETDDDTFTPRAGDAAAERPFNQTGFDAGNAKADDPDATIEAERCEAARAALEDLSIDEILALSDDSPTESRESTLGKDDTGEWASIEDMLAPEVMLRDSRKKQG